MSDLLGQTLLPLDGYDVGTMEVTATGLDRAAAFLERVAQLNARYRAGEMRVHVPEELRDGERSLEDLVEQHLPASHARSRPRRAACSSRCRWPSIPPSRSGRTSAIVDRDAAGEPYRFLDMGALIATQAFGENDPAVVRAVLESLPFVTSRYAHSEYQTVLSLRLKAELNRIAPAGTPRHFVVNTGAEAVENAIKAVLMNRVMTSADGDGGFIVSFEGAFHGRTLGASRSRTARRRGSAFRRSTGRTSRFRSRRPARRRRRRGARSAA